MDHVSLLTVVGLQVQNWQPSETNASKVFSMKQQAEHCEEFQFQANYF